ncbi:prepilin-type N-terminal cleavage/methylation domain-containing protein [Pseudoalteromonas sp. R3]|nr:prepilin-type N-terminal cleavage/methylation domain-containing protein [Pseudoalteromonas sp. R3]
MHGCILMNVRNCFGFTLFELIICMALFGVMVLLSAPAIHTLTELDRPKTALLNIDRHLTLSRLLAITHNAPVTMCPLVNGHCTTQWHKELTVFTDYQDRAQFDNGDIKLMVLSGITTSDTLEYPRKAITFKHTGTLRGFGNGTFVYCARRLRGDPIGLALSVSVVGRSRLRETTKCH